MTNPGITQIRQAVVKALTQPTAERPPTPSSTPRPQPRKTPSNRRLQIRKQLKLNELAHRFAKYATKLFPVFAFLAANTNW
jgi:hypothetical protein